MWLERWARVVPVGGCISGGSGSGCDCGCIVVCMLSVVGCCTASGGAFTMESAKEFHGDVGMMSPLACETRSGTESEA